MKAFDSWNIEKQYIDIINNTLYIKEREIRHTKLWVNIWNEENGKTNFLRSMLVIKKIGNLFFTLPLTTKGKENYFYYRLNSVYFWFSSHLTLSQWRTIDKKRFIEKILIISKNEIKQIKKILTDMYLSE